MLIRELIGMAKSGEMKNVAIKPDEEDIVQFINLGLIELYKRFPLDTDEFLIELEAGVTEYVMPADFMYLTSAYEELAEGSLSLNNRLPINDEEDPMSVNMVAWNTVQIPAIIDGSFISLIYVSSPEYIVYDEEDKTHMDLQLQLPIQLVEAMLHYMGYRAHGSITSELKAEDNTHYQRFEASCSRAKSLGLVTAESLKSHHKFGNRGFA